MKINIPYYIFYILFSSLLVVRTSTRYIASKSSKESEEYENTRRMEGRSLRFRTVELKCQFERKFKKVKQVFLHNLDSN